MHKSGNFVFGENEFSFRLIPFIAGIFSIFVFYYLSKIVLKTKPAIILANFLFSINFLLIRYTSEFKQYGTDILIFMLVLIWLSKAPKLQNPDFKTILKYSLLFLILFLTSQPVIFLLFGFILYNALSCIKQNRTDFSDLFKIISVNGIKVKSNFEKLTLGGLRLRAGVSRDFYLSTKEEIKEEVDSLIMQCKQNDIKMILFSAEKHSLEEGVECITYSAYEECPKIYKKTYDFYWSL